MKLVIFILAVATTATAQNLNLNPTKETKLDIHVSKTLVHTTGHWISTDGQQGFSAVFDIKCERRTMTCTELEATAADIDGATTLEPESMEYNITRWTETELVATKVTGVTGVCKMRHTLKILLNEGRLLTVDAPSKPITFTSQTPAMCRITYTQELKGGTSFWTKPGFPKPNFVLHDAIRQPEKPKVEFSPTSTDKSGETAGTFTVAGGSSLIQLASLSFSADGKLLVVGSTPSIVDIWDVDKQTKIRSFEGGITVAVSPQGNLLATNGNGIDIWDMSSGKLKRTINWAGGMIWRMSFDPSGRWLLVTANGENDSVFDSGSGEKIVALANTREARFSTDGAMVVGGNAQHIIVWNTKDWSQIRDLPNGPDYVTRVAVHPDKDLVVIGGAKSARLIRLSSGQEVATVGDAHTKFAAFNRSGSLIFTYTHSGLVVWDITGKRICGASVGNENGIFALSPDDRWFAAGIVDGGTDVMVWKVENILKTCGISADVPKN